VTSITPIRGRHHCHVVFGNLEQSEAQLKTPLLLAAVNWRLAMSGLIGASSAVAPVDVTAERTKAAAHIHLVRDAVLDDAIAVNDCSLSLPRRALVGE